MNILHIITHYDPVIYGAENFAKHVAEYQANKKENKVWVVTGKWRSQWKGDEIINGVNVVRVPCLNIRYIQTILAVIPLYLKASEILKKQKIHRVHTHIYPGMIVGYLLHKRHKVPYIATIQGGDIGDYDEVFGAFKIVAKLLIGFCLKKASKVHCVSNYLANQVKKIGVDKNKILVIPNGVDTNKYQVSSIKYQEKKKDEIIRLVSTSRLEKKNNLTQLIDIIKQMNDKGYQSTLDIFGTGSLETTLINQIRNLKLEKNVFLKSYIKQELLSSILPNYDYFVRLSIGEGFGISFIEAMACGVIPVALKSGGVVDIIDSNKNGFLLNSDNLEQEFETVIKSQNNNDILRKLAIEKVKSRFDWSIILPKLEILYD